jgi:hypothetical protein
VPACVEEDVLEQWVAMRNAFTVDVRDRREDLPDDASNESVAVGHRRTEVRKQCVARRVLHYGISIQIIGQERVHVNDPGWRNLMMARTSQSKRASACSLAIEFFGMVFTA